MKEWQYTSLLSESGRLNLKEDINMKTKKKIHSLDKQKRSGSSFKKNIAIAAVAASLGVSLGVPVPDVLAGDENISTQHKENVSSVQHKENVSSAQYKENVSSAQHKVESNQNKHKSNQIKVEANQGKFKSDQVKGEIIEENVQK
jgi:hypothetical protein